MIQTESLNGIITFVTAARATSFTEAAQHLGISKSAVGKAVARLEDRLGVKLFHRTTRKISLTADGEAYYAACASALNEIETAEQSLTSPTRIPSGRLRIDVPIAYGQRIILPMLASIAREFTDLRYTITFNDHLIDLIEDGVDLAIRLGHLGSTSGLVAKQLYSERWLICAHPDYLTAMGTPTTLEDLNHHHCIVNYMRNHTAHWKVTVNGQSDHYTPPQTFQIGDGEAIIRAAVAGLGICQMPESLLRPHINQGELAPILENYCITPVNVYAVWPQTKHLRPKVRIVVDILAEMGKKI